MFYRVLNTGGAQNVPTKGFLGLNRRKKGQEGECVACSNVSGDEFPVLSSVRGVKQICKAPVNSSVVAYIPEDDGSFTGLVQKLENGKVVNRFYYKGEDKTGQCTIEFDKDSKLIRTDGKIILLPQMLQFEYWRKDAVLGNLGKQVVIESLSHEDYSAKASIANDQKKALSKFSIGEIVRFGYLASLPDSQKEMNTTIEQSRYSTTDKRTVISSKTEISIDFKMYVGENEYNFGAKDVVAGCTMYKYIPKMSNFCIFQNRLWGTSENGENIYASAPGEYDTFFRYQNLATDSWSVDIMDYNKPFTGMAVYNEAVYCFKEDKVYVIYGSYAQNFSVDRTMDGCGCIQSDSVIVAGNALYWLGHEGIYRYTGGTPRLISEKLGRKYTYAKALAGNGVIYWQLTYKDGDGLGGEFLRYDTEYGLWHSIDEEKRLYLGGETLGNRAFIHTASTIYELEAGEFGEWSFESVDFYNDTFDNTGAFQIHLRADLKAGSSIKVEYKGSGESEWQNCGEYVADKDISIKECFIPRFSNFPSYRYRLSGTGEVYIYELERNFHKGGRNVR